MRFLGRIPQDDIPALLNLADVSVVGGLQNHPLSQVTLPSKVQVALAAGRPNLASASGDAARIAVESGGFAAPPGDVNGLAAQLRTICALAGDELAARGRQARDYYLREFNRETAVKRIETLLERAAKGRL